LTAAIEDLRKAAEEATGEARARIDSALDQVRQASDQAASRAQSAAGDLRAQLDEVRGWIQSASADLLDEVQKEIDKRRDQLLGGDSKSEGPPSSGAA
jgi:uncharacterized protein YjbJ (UPF0337 family)